MKNTTALLLLDPDTPDSVITEFASSAYEPKNHLSCLVIGPTPVLPMYAVGLPPYGGMSLPDDWGETVKSSQKALIDREGEIETLLARAGVSADVQSVLCATMEIKDIVARKARVCDVAYLAPNLRDTPNAMREMAHGVLFKSPIGLMLNAEPSRNTDKVLVAWDSSEAASRAAHVALPYLRSAKEVVIACFDPVARPEQDGADPGADVAAWLSHHGCNVTVSQQPTGGREVADCILGSAKEQGADLVVMGAYGHARMIEAVFGGTTRTMIEQTDQQVLLAH